MKYSTNVDGIILREVYALVPTQDGRPMGFTGGSSVSVQCKCELTAKWSPGSAASRSWGRHHRRSSSSYVPHGGVKGKLQPQAAKFKHFHHFDLMLRAEGSSSISPSTSEKKHIKKQNRADTHSKRQKRADAVAEARDGETLARRLKRVELRTALDAGNASLDRGVPFVLG